MRDKAGGIVRCCWLGRGGGRADACDYVYKVGMCNGRYLQHVGIYIRTHIYIKLQRKKGNFS